MIIQIKSSYSGGLTYDLEEKQELYISHTPETHAYVQKTADANAVARLYLLNGELHLAPVSRSGKIFLQNRPFTEDTVLGRESLLQIKENVLLFQIDGEVVILMMGLVLGYGSTSGGKNVKARDLTPMTPSQAEETQPPKGGLIRPSVQLATADDRKTHDVAMPKKTEGKPSEKEEVSETDILLSESSTTTVGEILESVQKKEELSKSNKGKWGIIAACMMIVLCVAMWFAARRIPLAPNVNEPSSVAEKTETAVSESVEGTLEGDTQKVVEEETVSQNVDTSIKTAVGSDVVSPKTVTPSIPPVSPTAVAPVASPVVAEQKIEETLVENVKPAVTLDERLALAKKELAELSKTVDAPPELLEDKRFGQDMEWMMASFDKLKVSLRKVQIRELEKQMAVYQRAKNLDVSKFSEAATADFQKRFKEYTVTKGWGYRNNDIEFSRNFINELKKGQLNPNMIVEDSKSQEYSGPILACILSGKIELADEIAHELLKLGADSDVCLERKERLQYSKAWPVVLVEGGVNSMEGFLLPLLSKQDFYISMFVRDKRNTQSEDLVTSLIWQKHNLTERDEQGNTPLHFAAKLGVAKLVMLMLLEGADVNAMNENGEAPLNLAIKYGHMQLEPLLLEEGANLTLKTVTGETAEDFRKVGLFFQSIEKKDYASVRKALENGMSPNMFCDNGATILQMASRDNDVEMARILLEFNANPDLAGKPYPLEYRPIAWAFREKCLDIVEMLLEKGADPNEDLPSYRGNSLLNVLCSNSYPASGFDKETTMKYLKAFLNAQKPVKLDNYRGLLISVALENKRDSDFVSLLLDKYESFPAGNDVIAKALFYEYPDSIVEKIIEKKSDVNALFTVPTYVKGTSSRPPHAGQKTMALWLAVEMNRPKIVKLLLKNGADVNWKDENGKTVKDLPCLDEIRQLLLNPNTKTADATEPEKQEDEKEQPAMTEKTIDLGNGVTMILKPIPKGSFVMGSPENELGRFSNEKQHHVTLTKDYWLGQYEVTQRQYETVIRTNPSLFKKGGDYPVETVSWDDAMAFCKKLTEQERKAGRLPNGYEYSLPTEAQWEYACRAGTTTSLNSGKNLTREEYNCANLDEVGWYTSNSGNSTHPVGQKEANAWGLYDMHGNVWEWSRDWYGSYSDGATTDPMGPKNGSDRVVRGGSWGYTARGCRPSFRNFFGPSSLRSDGVGFRVALVPVDSKSSGSSGTSSQTEAGTKKSDIENENGTANDTIESRTVALPGGVELKLVKIKAGSFMMGSPEGEEGRYRNEQQHKVTLAKDYWLGQYEVTQAQYVAVMKTNPSSNKKGGDYTVECVSWNDAMAFCKKLTEMEHDVGRLPVGYEYSLPTEAQWEYACRAGTTTAWCYGDSLSSKQDNFDGTYSGGEAKTGSDLQYITRVRSDSPNGWGLYDMHGNVFEWCRDWYGNYPNGAVTDPQGPSIGTHRVLRGGAERWNARRWNARHWNARPCRSAFRYKGSPGGNWESSGFRVALVPVESIASASMESSADNDHSVTQGERHISVSQDVQSSVESEKKTITLPGGVELKLVKIKAGSFMMGSPEDEEGRDSDEQQHKVTLTKDYWLGQYEVTQDQFEAIMGDISAYFRNGGNYPAECVSWGQAMSFCKKLTKIEHDAGRLPVGYEYSLPTEAQWEYAARGGCKSKGYKYSGSNNLDEVGWNLGGISSTKSVGTKGANELDIYDMSGNAWEWCRDSCYWKSKSGVVVTDTYRNGVEDPWCRVGSDRVVRGGSWYSNMRSCRSASRFGVEPTRFGSCWYPYGFRVALVPVDSNTSISDKIINTEAGKKTADSRTIIETTNKTIENKRIDGVSVEWKGNKTITLPGGVELRLVKIEPGTNSIPGYARDTMKYEYWLGETEVTQGQYAAIMEGVINEIGKTCNPRPSYFNGNDRLPVETVSWYDAKAFCNKLNRLFEEKLPQGYKIDLPTWSQWRFAARGGNKSQEYKFSGGNDIETVAWYAGNSDEKTHPVGTKRANELGLFDMNGNVTEWCQNEHPWTKSNVELSVDDEWRFVIGGCFASRADGFDPWGSRGGCNTKDFAMCFRGGRIAVVPINTNSSVSSDSNYKTKIDLKEVNVKTVSVSGNSQNDIEYKVLTLPKNVEMELLKINPGSFLISKTNKKITLTREYWLGVTEVTQGQYVAIMDGGINEKGKICRSRPSYFTGDDQLPVESVSWYDAKAFCKKLNSLFKGKLPQGYQFDLPTEAQWEFAARGGNKSKGYDYSGSNSLDKVGWYRKNSGKNRVGDQEHSLYDMIHRNDCKTHPVGKKRMNELGLFDMSGNVWEWCRDVYEKDFAQDPEFLRGQPSDSFGRVLRGGGWNCKESNCSSMVRYHYDVTEASGDLGFRIALVAIDSSTSASSDDANKTEATAEKALTEQVVYVNDVRVDGAEFGKWTHDWDAAVAAAKKNEKLIFVNFTGSDWCGWCKLLKSKVFSQPEWISLASSNLYLVHLDFPNDQTLVPEKYRARNRELARRYDVSGYPTCFLLDQTTLKPLGQFGASRDITAKAFVEKVATAMSGGKKTPTAEPARQPESAKQPNGKKSGKSEQLPVDRFPLDGRIAWFDFSEGNVDKAHPGRSFNCENVPIKRGTMQFNGDYGRCDAVLHVPELRYDHFSVAISFQYRAEKGQSRPLIVFGGGWRWFHIRFSSDGMASVIFGGIKNDKMYFKLPEKIRLDAWNWIVASFDAAGRRLSVVLNGRRLSDIALPSDFAFRFSEEVRKRNRNVQFKHMGFGDAFKGVVSEFLLFDRALTSKELNTIADIPGAEQDSIADVSDAPAALWKYRLDEESMARWKSSLDRNSTAPWKFSPAEEGAALYWNGAVSDGSVTLEARLAEGAVTVSFPEKLSVPNGVLDLRKPILDAAGIAVPLIGIGLEDDRLNYASWGLVRNVSEVRLPETIRFLGFRAFEEVASLERIDCPDSVVIIESSAFMACRSLRRFRLGRGVETFSTDRVFMGCEVLESIETDPENRHYKTIGGAVFTADGKQLVAFPPGYKGSFTIPSGVEEIPARAFLGCRNLTRISVPASMKKIGERAFEGCVSLEMIEFENRSFKLDDRVFGGSRSGETVHRPKTNLMQ